MIYEVELEGTTRSIDVTADGDGWIVKVDGGEPKRLTGKQFRPAAWRIGGRVQRLHIDKDRFSAQLGGRGFSGAVFDPRAHALDAAGGAAQGRIVTPMPGVVVRIVVEQGQQVSEGDVLVVVEAMKMENEFKSPMAGTVAEIPVQPGQALEANSLLIVVEPSE